MCILHHHIPAPAGVTSRPRFSFARLSISTSHRSGSQIDLQPKTTSARADSLRRDALLRGHICCLIPASHAVLVRCTAPPDPLRSSQVPTSRSKSHRIEATCQVRANLLLRSQPSHDKHIVASEYVLCNRFRHHRALMKARQARSGLPPRQQQAAKHPGLEIKLLICGRAIRPCFDIRDAFRLINLRWNRTFAEGEWKQDECIHIVQINISNTNLSQVGWIIWRPGV
ncbi:hypothetical protein C8J57DRAFT_1306258 [Mycena rebaudengoi]|nr:hypothetical protein C8J57DRAFT_1306258 [Mycena rebaudengoi]